MQQTEVERVCATETEETSESVEILNSLRQGQLAAADAVRTLLDAAARFVLEDVDELHRCESDHRRTAAELREEIVRLRGRPAESAGAWKAFTEAYVECASLFGPKTALEVLLESEQHEIDEMKQALFCVPPETRRLLKESLLPREKRHIRALGALLERRLG